tara:strand:+ start:3372 stop:3515 length:144 start_codon:yes stop_codon:yes gene_type:complete
MNNVKKYVSKQVPFLPFRSIERQFDFATIWGQIYDQWMDDLIYAKSS